MSTAEATAADLVTIGGADYDVPPMDAAMVAVILSAANTTVTACAWGEQRTLGATLFALHLLDEVTGKASSGIVTAHSVDSIAESFTTPWAFADADGAKLQTTRWGRAFAVLASTLIAIPIAVKTGW